MQFYEIAHEKSRLFFLKKKIQIYFRMLSAIILNGALRVINVFRHLLHSSR